MFWDRWDPTTWCFVLRYLLLVKIPWVRVLKEEAGRKIEEAGRTMGVRHRRYATSAEKASTLR